MVDTGRVTVQTRDLEKAIEAVTRVYCSHQIAITGRVPEIDAVLRVCGPTAQPLVSLSYSTEVSIDAASFPTSF
jgi:hypothetical protein